MLSEKLSPNFTNSEAVNPDNGPTTGDLLRVRAEASLLRRVGGTAPTTRPAAEILSAEEQFCLRKLESNGAQGISSHLSA